MSMLNDDTRAGNISALDPLKRCLPSEPVTCNPIVPKPKLGTRSLRQVQNLQCSSSNFMAYSWGRHEKSLIIKRDLILEILGTAGSLTERDILKQIGDNRYSREIVRKLLQDGLIYRVGKVSFYLYSWPRSSLYFAGRCKRSVQIRCCWTLLRSRQGAPISTHSAASANCSRMISSQLATAGCKPGEKCGTNRR